MVEGRGGGGRFTQALTASVSDLRHRRRRRRRRRLLRPSTFDLTVYNRIAA